MDIRSSLEGLKSILGVDQPTTAGSQAKSSDRKLQEYRWMLEELRVSLFAQELKTPMPVSVKRLQKVWESLQR